MSKLPKEWATTSFDLVAEVTDFVANGSFAALKENVHYLDDGYAILVRLTDWKKDWQKQFVYVSKESFRFLSKSTLSPCDIVISCVGEPGQVFQVPDLGRPMTLGPNSVRVRELDAALYKTYFAYYWKSAPGQRELAKITTGTTQLKFNKTGLRASNVILPPLPEQKRIADKLDSTLARVEACRDRLDRLPALLKRFRQSILAAATSGRLTEDWRATSSPADEAQHNPGTAAELLTQIASEQTATKTNSRGAEVTPSLADLPDAIDLPKDWEVAGFDALAAPFKNALKAGPFGSALKKHMYVPAGYKIYGQEQVIAGDENIGNYFIDEEKFQELSNCAIRPGDILISLVGTIGRVLILSEHAKPGIINPRLVKLSLHPVVSREYISLYLVSPTAQNFFGSQSHGGTMDILNLGILRKLPILLPSAVEQAEIVRRVETLFAFADRLEARLATARQQVEQLTPALLAKAFRGELVPQDPNDEPASELLKRIAANRSEAPKARRGRKEAA